MREADGLAMSSRNVYLNTQERVAAPHLYAVLKDMAKDLSAGREVEETVQKGWGRLEKQGFRVDYLEVRDAEDFDARRAPAGEARAPAGGGCCRPGPANQQYRRTAAWSALTGLGRGRQNRWSWRQKGRQLALTCADCIGRFLKLPCPVAWIADPRSAAPLGEAAVRDIFPVSPATRRRNRGLVS